MIFPIELKQQNIFIPKKNSIYLQAKDQNGFNVPGIRAKITITNKKVNETFNKYEYIPLILWEQEIKLENLGETKVEIPQRLFPKANFCYNLKVEMWTPENEYFIKTEEVSYFYKQNDIKYRYINDSVEFYYTQNNVEQSINGYLYETNSFNIQYNIPYNKLNETKKVQLPYKIKINQFASSYKF